MKTYELAKRVEKIAPELGVRTSDRLMYDLGVGAIMLTSNFMPYRADGTEARLLLLGILQEWADGAGYEVEAIEDEFHPFMRDRVDRDVGCYIPVGSAAPSREEALVLCLEHSKGVSDVEHDERTRHTLATDDPERDTSDGSHEHEHKRLWERLAHVEEAILFLANQTTPSKLGYHTDIKRILKR